MNEDLWHVYLCVLVYEHVWHALMHAWWWIWMHLCNNKCFTCTHAFEMHNTWWVCIFLCMNEYMWHKHMYAYRLQAAQPDAEYVYICVWMKLVTYTHVCMQAAQADAERLQREIALHEKLRTEAEVREKNLRDQRVRVCVYVHTYIYIYIEREREKTNCTSWETENRSRSAREEPYGPAGTCVHLCTCVCVCVCMPGE